MQDGMMEQPASYDELTQREQSLPPSRYQGSLMGSYDSLTEQSND